jgi:hypothetical protein
MRRGKPMILKRKKEIADARSLSAKEGKIW